jgi:hypothetical protein
MNSQPFECHLQGSVFLRSFHVLAAGGDSWMGEKCLGGGCDWIR